MNSSDSHRWLLLACACAIGCASFSCRVRRLSDHEMAAECFQQARMAHLAGDLDSARKLYRRSAAWDEQNCKAWLALIPLVPPDQRASLREELLDRSRSAPTDPWPPFLAARLCEGEDARAHFQESWRRSPTPAAPLLDPAHFSPASWHDWCRYMDLLAVLVPRTQELEFRQAWSSCELGGTALLAESAAAAPVGDVRRELLSAWDGLASGHFERALELLSCASFAEAWEGRRLRVQALLALGRAQEAELLLLDRNSEVRASAERDVLHAFAAAQLGDRGLALAKLEGALEGVISPHLRVRGALLLAELLGELRRDPVGPLSRALDWAANDRDGDALFIALLNLQAVPEALAARTTAIRDAESAEGRRTGLYRERLPALRREVALLEALTGAPQLLPRHWGFLSTGSVAERRAWLARLEGEERVQLIDVALRQPEAALKIVALQAAETGGGIAWERIPSALATDVDPVVRAAWMRVAARQGGDTARQALDSGAQDPDSYVREVVEQLRSSQ